MVGRPPKTIEQHLADGTYRKDRHGDRLYAEASGAIGEPPEELSDEAAQIWRATAAALSAAAIAVSGLVEGAAV